MIFGITKSIIISVTLACFIQFFFVKIESGFVFEFLRSNITNLQVALLAVNTATLGIVLTKIREIVDRTGDREAFEETRREMILSIREQVFLIAFALLILAMQSAKLPIVEIPEELYHGLLLASFFYSILILYDTAKSVFVILEY